MYYILSRDVVNYLSCNIYYYHYFIITLLPLLSPNHGAITITITYKCTQLPLVPKNLITITLPLVHILLLLCNQ